MKTIRIVMGFIFILSILPAFMLPMNIECEQETKPWIAPAWTDTLKNPFSNDVKAIAEGKKLYESACWTCHGKEGKGDGPAAKGLITKPANHSRAQFQSQSDGAIFWKISKGKGQMSPYEKAYSKSQRWKLVAFIRTLKVNVIEK